MKNVIVSAWSLLLLMGAALEQQVEASQVEQQAYLKASNTDSGDSFGKTVAVSGDTIVVGAYNEEGAATGVNGEQASNFLDDTGALLPSR